MAADMTRVQRSEDQRQRHFCCKMDRLNVTRKLRAPRRHERLDILETFFEQNETLSDALRNSFLAIRDSQHTLQAFYDFRSHDVNKMVNNMDVLEEHLQGKIQERN